MQTQLESNSSAEPRLVRKTFAFYLPQDLVEQIDKVAKESEVTRSWVVMKVLRGWLNNKLDME